MRLTAMSVRAILLVGAVLAAVMPETPAHGTPAASWHLVSSPAVGDSAVLYGVEALSSRDAWAVGGVTFGRATRPLAEHWNGAVWNRAATPPLYEDGVLLAVSAASHGDAWAVGYLWNGYLSPSYVFQTLIEHWDGSSWSVVPSPSPGGRQDFLQGVASISSSDAWAVGYSAEPGGNLTLAEHWDGTAWTVVPTPNVEGMGTTLSAVTAVSPSDVWAVGGAFPSDYSSSVTVTMRWDGTSWNIVPSPDCGSYSGLVAVSSVSASDIWAGGNCSTVHATLTEHWDGSTWTQVPTAPDEPSPSFATSISASGRGAWLAGWGGPDGAEQTLTEQWDGAAWSVVPSPTPGGFPSFLHGVSIVPGTTQAWAVGESSNGRGTRGLIERYA